MLTLKEISDALSMPFEGDGSLPISGPSEPKNASENQLALAMTNSFLEDLDDNDDVQNIYTNLSLLSN